jgi:hypothetical protein
MGELAHRERAVVEQPGVDGPRPGSEISGGHRESGSDRGRHSASGQHDTDRRGAENRQQEKGERRHPESQYVELHAGDPVR